MSNRVIYNVESIFRYPRIHTTHKINNRNLEEFLDLKTKQKLNLKVHKGYSDTKKQLRRDNNILFATNEKKLLEKPCINTKNLTMLNAFINKTLLNYNL